MQDGRHAKSIERFVAAVIVTAIALSVGGLIGYLLPWP
jgi:hypothetical protein